MTKKCTNHHDLCDRCYNDCPWCEELDHAFIYRDEHQCLNFEMRISPETIQDMKGIMGLSFEEVLIEHVTNSFKKAMNEYD